MTRIIFFGLVIHRVLDASWNAGLNLGKSHVRMLFLDRLSRGQTREMDTYEIVTVSKRSGGDANLSRGNVELYPTRVQTSPQ